MSFVGAIAGWIESQGAQSHRRRITVAFAFGFAGALAFAPTELFPVLAVSFPSLIILLRTAPNLRHVFLTGWSFAFGFFLLGLYWVAAALFVDIRQFWWALPLAVAGLPALCAAFYGVAAVVAKRIGLHGLSGALIFALCWFLADYARGHMFTGFPWNLEGYVWNNVLPVMQSVSLFGVYGLTLITVVLACLPIALIDNPRGARKVLLGAIMALLGIVSWGAVRLEQNPTQETAIRIRVVQPNVEQAQKWDMASREEHFHQLLNFTSAPAEKTPSAIVWPETASTFYLAEDEEHRRAIAANLLAGSYVLTGVISRFVGDDAHIHYANSMVVLDRSGRIAETYDKFHLVPFGEYIPLRRVFSLHTLANLGVDFSVGQGLRTLRLEGLPSFSPLICYEAIFPGEVASRQDRPQILINITNDGWYGRTAGPYQHFISARTRAIEEGLPLVRSANTGISGVVDPYGRIMTKIDLGKTGYTDANIPEAAKATIYSRYGDNPMWVLFLAAAIGCAVLRRYKNNG